MNLGQNLDCAETPPVDWGAETRGRNANRERGTDREEYVIGFDLAGASHRRQYAIQRCRAVLKDGVVEYVVTPVATVLRTY
jgi:hypothetical protein